MAVSSLSPRQHPERLRRVIAASFVLSAVSVGPVVAQADTTVVAPSTTAPSRPATEEQPVLDRVNAAAPQAVAPFVEATRLMDDGDLTGAADKYAIAAELSGQQPDVLRRFAWVRLGQGRFDDARGLVENAVQRDRSGLNLLTYGTVVLSLADATKVGRNSLEKLSPQQQALLQTARTNMAEAQPLLLVAGDRDLLDQYDLVGAGIYEWLREYGNMLALTQSFVQRAPNDVDRLIELGRAEIAAGQRAEAGATIDRAFSLGASDATLAAHGLVRKPTPTSPLVTFAAGLAIAIGIIALLVSVLLAIGQIQTKRTLAWLEQPIGDDLTGEHKNRFAYRVIVRLAGVLYTLMLPVIVVLGLVVGIGFVLLMLAGRRLAFGEVQGTIMGFAKTVKVLVLRGWHRLFPKTVPETSRLITTEEAPALFAALKRVSAIVDTPPPDEVRMVPQASVSVHERFEKRGPVRVLTIGAAALADLEQQGFLAVLAHELGHLRGGDTRSGWSATRVSNHMRHLCSSLPNGLYALVVSRLLNLHWKVHHRVTNAAVRFQEVMADRVAVRAFGAEAFEEGLTQVVCNGVVFGELANRAVHSGRNLGLAASFYDESQLSDADLVSLEARAQAELDRPTTMFDSHPSPRDRFRYARMITAEPTERAEGAAWDLFVDADGLRAEMENELRRQTGIDAKILAMAAIN